mmetsp:Transcript_23190/g.45118  ORF Transcript_23190/g.45118 Transcript_23190/m.45118 type:complete len:490 (-) Transcript_23190:104-1573(-)
MDENEANVPEQVKTHVMISAMSYERISMTDSGRAILNLYMAAFNVTEGAAVAREMLRGLQAVSNAPEDQKDVDTYARLICGLSGGHARVLTKTVNKLNFDAEAKSRLIDLKDWTAVYEAILLPDVRQDGTDKLPNPVLEQILYWQMSKTNPDVQELINNTILTGNYSVADLIHSGQLVATVVQTKKRRKTAVLDVLPVVFLKKIGVTEIPRGGALWLLTELLKSEDVFASTYGERASAFFTAFALSSPSSDKLGVVLPTANSRLKQCTSLSWHSQTSSFDALQLEPSWKQVAWFEGGVEGTDIHKITDPWTKLCQYFKHTSTDLQRSSAHWKARLILAPPNCPAIDYLLHFYMYHKNHTVADIVFGVQVKTTFPGADAGATIVSKMKKSVKFLADHQAELGVTVHLCYHVGNTFAGSELDAKPEGVDVVTGEQFTEHFLPSLVRLLSIDLSDSEQEELGEPASVTSGSSGPPSRGKRVRKKRVRKKGKR